jgi:hypothetical protein
MGIPMNNEKFEDLAETAQLKRDSSGKDVICKAGPHSELVPASELDDVKTLTLVWFGETLSDWRKGFTICFSYFYESGSGLKDLTRPPFLYIHMLS